jgi:peptidoglycan/LPS O-acetylase OafA/YrhL
LYNSSKKRQFFTTLDSLRGIAALIVAIYHIRWMHPLYNWGLIRNGYLMVDFFFVLSGFVICHSYRYKISNGEDLVRFMWLRAGRLYPLHLAMLIAFLGFEGLQWIKELVTGAFGETAAFTVNNGFAVLTNLFLVQSLGTHQSTTFNSASWSISTEFYTYLIFALILLFARTRLTLFSSSIFLILLSTQIIFSANKTDLDFTYDYGIFRCVASFFIGIVTYQIHEFLSHKEGIYQKGKLTTIYPPAIFAGIVIFLSVKEIGYTDFLLPPLFAILILSITTAPNRIMDSVLNLRPLTWLGKISYSIYMVHALVLRLFYTILESVFKVTLIPSSGLNSIEIKNLVISTTYTTFTFYFIFLCLALTTIIFLSHLTYRWIEEPFRNMSKESAERWFPKEIEQVTSEPQKISVMPK